MADKLENIAKSATPFNIKIPGYKLKQILGKGGMASVYLAVQESFGRDVAIKVLAPDMARDEEFSERFLREAQIVSRLQHHNIVNVYDVGIHEGYHYLSMEYIPGKELREAKYDLSKSEVVRIVKEVARALEYAHRNGFIHRDVKPENIMLHENGERVILMDFGIARMTQSDMSVTKTGRVIGTPHYMSPEQTKGLSVDHRADIYSLGVVMYQMLAGRLPYDADSPVAVGIKHISDPIPLLPPGLEMFQTIINTCMSKDPTHRYQSAGELIAALDKLNANALAVLDARAKETKAKNKIVSTPSHDPTAATTVGSAIFENDTVIPVNKVVAEKNPKLDKIPPLVHPDPKKYQPRKTLDRDIDPGEFDFDEPKSRFGLIVFLLLLVGGSAWGYFNQPVVLKFYKDNLEPTVTKLAIDLGIKPKPTPAAVLKSEPVEQIADANQEEEAQADTVTSETNQAVLEQQPVVPGSKEQADQSTTAQSSIQELQAGLAEHPENAVELAKIYKEKLAATPGDLSARNGLSELRDWYRHELRDAMEEKDIKYARLLADQLQESFPKATERPRFQEMLKRLDHVEKISQHLSSAKEYMKQGALTEPVGANALSEYQIVLVLVPGHPEASQGIIDIAEAAYSKAVNAHARNKLKEAKRYVDSGLKAVPTHVKLKALQQKVDSRVSRIARHDKLNREAETLYLAGNMIIPEGESAYDKFKLVLKENPNNLKARSGLQSIEKSLLDHAVNLMEGGDLQKSKSILMVTREKFGTTPRLEETEFELNKQIRASEPKVLNVVFSNTKPASLKDMHNQKMKVYQTVYAGFLYKNFKQPGIELQANLLDGTGRIQIASTKVVLPAKEGKMIFSLDIPTKGIADGGYKLELTNGIKKFATGAFLNDNNLQ